MTISPADVFRAALVAALIAWPCGADAQTDEAPATGAPRQLHPAPVETAPETPSQPAEPPSQDNSAVLVSSLGAIEGAPAGLLDDTNGGLGTYIWSGTPRATIDKLLEALPIASPVYSERELARRLLLTIADAPVGSAPHAFLTVRLQELMSAGFVLEASIIAANARVANDPEYARTAADAILFAHAKDACSDATAGRLQYADKFWVELRAYCYAVAGDQPALDLTRGVMSAQGMTDPAFETLLDDALKHKTTDPGPIADPTSLDFFLLREAGLPIDPGMAKQLGMPAMIVALDNTKASAEDRAAVAEEVLRTGAVPMSHLIAVADAQVFTPDQLANAKSVAGTLPFFMGQALLRQAATHAEENPRKTAFVQKALELGLSANLLELAAGLQSKILTSLNSSAISPSDVELIVRGLMLTGHPDAAGRWIPTIDPKTFGQVAARVEIDLALTAPTPERDEKAEKALALLSTVASEKDTINDPSELHGFTELSLGFFDALNKPLSPEAKVELSALSAVEWQGRRPSNMAQLDEAMKQTGRKGEAILLILDDIGPNGTGDLAPDVTVKFVRMLVEEGMPDEAHQLALDSLLLYSPPPPHVIVMP
jgi:hypothetical protein